ncbi:outer membrane protein TolC [Pontibacter ummariensis]|uniref:Outer membrane protein TolC n=1 Tax=Pontibacter ummariensis TaxID=1610492 RepID=A0A239GJE9_9BACT|nr:TolC family protein [Pontibacter ummariensis]PRY11290.1 outer membrane protein TolC [Pontibacter ummariensis]SNS69015.1 Outer membrane protein TolC [Pontibacter ummariensis]
MIKKYFLVGLMLFCLKPAFAQGPVSGEVKALTLQESIQYALNNNQDVQKAYYDEQIGKQQIREAKSNGLPQLSANSGLDYFPALPTQILPGALAGQPGTDIPVQFGKDYNANANVQLTQLLFNKSYFVGLEAARTTQDLYRLRREMVQEDLIYNIGSAYLQALQTREQFNTIEANLERLTQLERIMQLQYENDLVKKVDVNRIKVSKTNLENQRLSLNTAFEQQKNMLKFFMGMPLEQDVALEDATISLEKLTATVDAATAAANKTQFQLLNTQKQLLNLQEKNIRAGYYPTLSAYGQYGYQTQRNELFDSSIPFFKSSVVGLKLSVPIFDGFRKDAQIKQAQLEQKKVEEDIEKFTTNTAVMLTNAVKQLENSENAIRTQEQNVDLAQEVYETTNQLYKEGLSPLTDLLDAEVSLREAKTNLNNEVLKFKIAQLSYLQAAGEIESLVK